MTVHQCRYCELRFRTEAEYNDHLALEHHVDAAKLEPFSYGRARHQKPLYPDLVEGVDDQRHQVLIVSNATLRAQRLQEHLSNQAAKQPTLFLLVVPALHTSRALQSQDTFVTVGDSAHPTEHKLSGDVLAEHRMKEALSRLRDAGLQIEGLVGDSDPMRAVAQGLRHFRADEIVLSTLPDTHSNWLAVDLPKELQRRYGIPVTTLPAG